MIVLFDLRDDMNLSEESLDHLIKGTSLWALSSEWRCFNDAHLDNVIVVVPDIPEKLEEDGDTSAD